MLCRIYHIYQVVFYDAIQSSRILCDTKQSYIMCQPVQVSIFQFFKRWACSFPSFTVKLFRTLTTNKLPGPLGVVRFELRALVFEKIAMVGFIVATSGNVLSGCCFS